MHRLAFGTNWEDRLKNTKWDVVIVDECHRLRMYGAGEDKKAQKWFRVAEKILTSYIVEDGRVYFLSGTPHQAWVLFGVPKPCRQVSSPINIRIGVSRRMPYSARLA